MERKQNKQCNNILKFQIKTKRFQWKLTSQCQTIIYTILPCLIERTNGATVLLFWFQSWHRDYTFSFWFSWSNGSNPRLKVPFCNVIYHTPVYNQSKGILCAFCLCQPWVYMSELPLTHKDSWLTGGLFIPKSQPRSGFRTCELGNINRLIFSVIIEYDYKTMILEGCVFEILKWIEAACQFPQYHSINQIYLCLCIFFKQSQNI